MFNIWLDYPTFEEELNVVKNTTSDKKIELPKVMTGEEIIYFQGLVRRVPVTDNVMEYAVRLVHKTRPNEQGSDIARNYISWGAGPRASQNLIMGAKCYALLHGKFSPDIEDVKAVALPILRHRLVRNYKAEAEGLKIEDIIAKLL
jgi:MoxR-like ATPase